MKAVFAIVVANDLGVEIPMFEDEDGSWTPLIRRIRDQEEDSLIQDGAAIAARMEQDVFILELEDAQTIMAKAMEILVSGAVYGPTNFLANIH